MAIVPGGRPWVPSRSAGSGASSRTGLSISTSGPSLTPFHGTSLDDQVAVDPAVLHPYVLDRAELRTALSSIAQKLYFASHTRY
jgi:hypothetical protein